MRLWVADFKFCLAAGLRVVGVTLGVVAWVSVVGAEMQQSSDVRTVALVGAAIVSVLIVQAFTGLPPSARVAAVVRSFDRDLVTVARERARGDDARARAIA